MQAHLDRFKDLSPSEKSEAVAKWTKFYPGYPCPIAPQDAPKIEQQPAKDIQVEPEDKSGGHDETSPEKSELSALRSELSAYAAKYGAYLLQVQMARSLGKSDEAQQYFQQALQWNAGSLDAWGGAVDQLIQTQNFTDAEKLSLAFLEKNPNAVPVLRTLARNISD